MSNFVNIYRNYNHENQNIITKKYDSNILSSNNINFILASNKLPIKKEEKIINNDQINSTDKIISFNNSQSKPYYKYNHIYTIPSNSKFNLIHTLGNIENDIKIGNVNNKEINVKSCVDNRCNCFIKKNINDFCFACKRNYENEKTKIMLKEMFKGQEIETFTKTVHIKTFNSPSKYNKNKTNNKNTIINFSTIKNENNDNNQNNLENKEIDNNNINSNEDNINIINKIDESEEGKKEEEKEIINSDENENINKK